MFEDVGEKNEKNKITNWEELTPKNILIYGESKVGKTYAALGLIKKELQKNKESKLYIVNTDMGFAEPAKQLGLQELKDRITYYYVTDIRDAISIVSELKHKVKRHDIVLFDLVSWIWSEAQQEELRQVSGDDPVNFMSNAMKDPKKFGMFTGKQWQTVKAVDSQVTGFLTRNLKCTIIGITGVKDTEVEDAMSKSTQGIYSKVGKPEGRKDLSFEFATIIRIFRHNETFQRSFIVTGTRSVNLTDFTPIAYNSPEEIWETIEKMKVL